MHGVPRRRPDARGPNIGLQHDPTGRTLPHRRLRHAVPARAHDGCFDPPDAILDQQLGLVAPEIIIAQTHGNALVGAVHDYVTATIYNWKDGYIPTDEYEWHIGGFDHEAVECVEKVLDSTKELV